ncbi:MAG: Wzz/FepE/Etk N-terminal domain-containing protein [Candidatus Omnitrophota bacterium]
MNQLNQQNCEEIEIDLREYINVIIKHKAIIITTFFLSIIVAFILSFLSPKVFETHAIIRLGSISTVLISKPNAMAELQGQGLMNLVLKENNLNNDKGEFSSKKILKVEDTKDTEFLKITVRNSSPILSETICNAIASKFVSEKKELFKKNILFLNEQINEFQKRYQIVVTEIDNFNKKILDFTVNPNYPLLQNTITNYESICFSLRERVFSLKEQELKSQDFEVFEPAVIPGFAIKPSVRKNVAVAGAIGLIFSLFLVFIIEYWRKLNQK